MAIDFGLRGGLITAAEAKTMAVDQTNNKRTTRGWRGDMIELSVRFLR
jgi:hypothetical protein